jgi:outer membrane biosynthesis protein TonB
VDSDRRFKYALFVSLLLHVLFFLGWATGLRLDLLGADEIEPIDDNPIVFEFIEPEQQQMPREVIETPEDADITDNPEQADFLSDKNALARNQEEAPDELDPGGPFSRGDYAEVHELITPPGQDGQPGINAEEQQQDEQNEASRTQDKSEKDPPEEQQDVSGYYAESEPQDFSEYLRNPQNASPAVPEGSRPKPRHDNEMTRAINSGGLTFNTYNWDFAPYMLLLKKKIEGNIFPPAAYTRMGMISGDTLLKFRIYPDGALKLLEVLDTRGHHTLMETSVKAIEVSAPFPELPKNFPEEYLEVTAKFIYFGREDKR